jgi:molybdate-binding protein/DNA-binding XRE family transcriptional regulator
VKHAFPESDITNNLAQVRKRNGWSASALATEVGVSRQAIHAMEAGTYTPNTALSLRLAQALGVHIEELFQLKNRSKEQSPGSVKADLIPSSSESWPAQPVQLCRIDGRLLAAQPAPADWYLPVSDGVADSKGSAGKVQVRLHQSDSNFDNRLIIAGCDPAMSVVARHLQTAGVQAILVHQNSSTSLSLLKKGCVHVAGTHLRDAATGEANMAAITKSFRPNAVAVISFAAWQEGFVTATGNPKRIKAVEDLARNGTRFVNREAGAGTRLLLDNALARLHMKSSQIRGYDCEAPGHLAAALQVKTGAADCCVATEAAARVFGLTFVPLEAARYDLVIRRSHLAVPAVRTLLDIIVQAKFRRELTGSAGYDTRVTGARVL